MSLVCPASAGDLSASEPDLWHGMAWHGMAWLPSAWRATERRERLVAAPTMTPPTKVQATGVRAPASRCCEMLRRYAKIHSIIRHLTVLLVLPAESGGSASSGACDQPSSPPPASQRNHCFCCRGQWSKPKLRSTQQPLLSWRSGGLPWQLLYLRRSRQNLGTSHFETSSASKHAVLRRTCLLADSLRLSVGSSLTERKAL